MHLEAISRTVASLAEPPINLIHDSSVQTESEKIVKVLQPLMSRLGVFVWKENYEGKRRRKAAYQGFSGHFSKPEGDLHHSPSNVPA